MSTYSKHKLLIQIIATKYGSQFNEFVGIFFKQKGSLEISKLSDFLNNFSKYQQIFDDLLENRIIQYTDDKQRVFINEVQLLSFLYLPQTEKIVQELFGSVLRGNICKQIVRSLHYNYTMEYDELYKCIFGKTSETKNHANLTKCLNTLIKFQQLTLHKIEQKTLKRKSQYTFEELYSAEKKIKIEEGSRSEIIDEESESRRHIKTDDDDLDFQNAISRLQRSKPSSDSNSGDFAQQQQLDEQIRSLKGYKFSFNHNFVKAKLIEKRILSQVIFSFGMYEKRLVQKVLQFLTEKQSFSLISGTSHSFSVEEIVLALSKSGINIRSHIASQSLENLKKQGILLESNQSYQLNYQTCVKKIIDKAVFDLIEKTHNSVCARIVRLLQQKPFLDSNMICSLCVATTLQIAEGLKSMLKTGIISQLIYKGRTLYKINTKFTHSQLYCNVCLSIEEALKKIEENNKEIQTLESMQAKYQELNTLKIIVQLKLNNIELDKIIQESNFILLLFHTTAIQLI